MHSGKSIKPLLLEQKLVAGLGNIYVDEVLWAAKVHPETPANKLSKAAMKRVHDQTIAILQLGIAKGGSTIRTYRNALGEDGTMQNYLQVYGKTGQPCPRCASMIVKIKLGEEEHICVLIVKNDDYRINRRHCFRKSTVVEIIKDAGYKVIDADQLVHDMQVKGEDCIKPCLIGWEMGFFFLMGN